MKQAILTLLSSLIHSMKQESVRYHSIILPLIQKSVEPGSVSGVVCKHTGVRANSLLGDSCLSPREKALDLWSAIITQTPSSRISRASLPDPIPLPYLRAWHRQCTPSPRGYRIVPYTRTSGTSQRQHSFPNPAALEALLRYTAKQQIGVVPHIVEDHDTGCRVC